MGKGNGYIHSTMLKFDIYAQFCMFNVDQRVKLTRIQDRRFKILVSKHLLGNETVLNIVVTKLAKSFKLNLILL